MEFCDALELTDVDLVAKDTGGAITQLFATGNPERLHTPTPTNCEAHDNLPPPTALLNRPGKLWKLCMGRCLLCPIGQVGFDVSNGRCNGRLREERTPR